MSRSDLKLGHVGSKTRSHYKMSTIKCTVLIPSSQNFVRLLIIIISRSGFKLGHVRLKTRSEGQILEKHQYYLVGTVFIISS